MDKGFLALAPEMQEKIICQRIELIILFSQVNSEYKSLLEHQYIKQVGILPLTRKELVFVTDKQPITVAKFERYVSIDRIEFAIIIQSFELCKEVIKVVIDNTNGISVQNADLLYLAYYYNSQSTYDVITAYNIHAHRLSCIRINPNYPKDCALAVINHHQSSYNKFVNTNIDFEYKCSIINTYLGLFIDKYTFNIFDNSKLTKLINIEDNIDDIKHDIAYLFEIIRNKILAL